MKIASGGIFCGSSGRSTAIAIVGHRGSMLSPIDAKARAAANVIEVSAVNAKNNSSRSSSHTYMDGERSIASCRTLGLRTHCA